MKTSFVPPKKHSKAGVASQKQTKYSVHTGGSGSVQAEKARAVVGRDPEAAAKLLRAWMKGEME